MAANAGVPEPALKLDIQKTTTETVIRCTGKITLETAPLLQGQVRALLPETKCIVVDLEHVAYIDSAGLGALVGIWSSAKRKSAEVGFRWPEAHGAAAAYEVKLVHFNDYVRKLLHITRLDKLSVFPTSRVATCRSCRKIAFSLTIRGADPSHTKTSANSQLVKAPVFNNYRCIAPGCWWPLLATTASNSG